MKYMPYAREAHDEINSSRPIRYIADRRRGEGKEKKKRAPERVRLITALAHKTALTRGDVPWVESNPFTSSS